MMTTRETLTLRLVLFVCIECKLTNFIIYNIIEKSGTIAKTEDK